MSERARPLVLVIVGDPNHLDSVAALAIGAANNPATGRFATAGAETD
jgi:hypothetical protein